jgi:hypothetical protein
LSCVAGWRWFSASPRCRPWPPTAAPPTGADGIGLGRDGRVYAVHYEDPRLLEYDPKDERIRERPAGKASATLASQAGRLVGETYDYAQDNGLDHLAVDKERGIAWATRFGSDELLRFDLGAGEHSIIRLPGRVVGGRGDLPLAGDGSVRVLVADNGDGRLENGRVIVFGADGTMVAEIPLPHAAFLSPQIVLDRQERLWLAASAVTANGTRPWLHRLESGRWHGGPLNGGFRHINGLAVDHDDRLWFAAVGNKVSVGTIRAQTALTEVRLLPKSHPHALKAADGGVWFADWECHRLGCIDRRGRLRESPLALAVAPDGKSVWFSTLFNYGLFRLDVASGRTACVATPASAHKSAAADVCDAKPVPAQVRPGWTKRPLCHPAGHGRDDAASLFERNCHTAYHGWYRVEQAASRCSDWTAMVDRMIHRNGAAFIGNDERRRILVYLHERYSRR